MPPTLEELERAWIELHDATPPAAQRLRVWAFREILHGRTPTIARASTELKFTLTQATEVLATLREAGLLTARDGTITGSMGLTTETTQHELALEGRRLHVWCALDAVGMPAALQKPAHVASRTADTARPVQLEYDGSTWTPSDAFDVLVTLPETDDCINEDVCPTMNFYARGAAPQHARASALSIRDAAKLGVALWRRYA